MTELSESTSRARPTKLCVLLPDHWAVNKGGAEYQASLLVDYLLKEYSVEVTYLTLEPEPQLVPRTYRIVCFSSRRGIRRYGSFFDVFRLYRALVQLAPDVIYQQVGCAHTGIAAHYGKRYGCPMIWQVASDSDLVPENVGWRSPHRVIERKFLEYGIRNAHTIVAQTHYQQTLLASRYQRRDAVVVRNFHPSPAAAAFDRRQHAPKKRIIWIANLKPLKNPEAFARLAASFANRTDAEFFMVGASQGKESWLARLTTMIERAPNLKYLGAREQSEVNALLCDSYALVNTSDYEGFSNTFIQAWMRGVPVVSLNVNPDGLLDSEGIGIVSGSEQRLHEDVSRLLDDQAFTEAMGARARSFALAQFSEANIDTLAMLLGLERR